MSDEFLIKCERMDNFGRGIGKINGKIIFVPDFFIGEEAVVKVFSDKKSFMEGKIISLKKESIHRICAKCKYDECGCALKNLSYEKTLEYKKEKVYDVLKRIGGVSFDIKTIVPSKNMYGYRNKVTLKVRNGKIGYFKNNSNELISIDKCLIASSRINKIIEVIRGENLALVEEIIIKDMDEVMVIIKGMMDITNIKKYADSIFINDNLVYGKEKILKTIGDYKFLISKDAFFQINSDVAEELYLKIAEYAGVLENAVDLYCGTGTIGLFLSKNFKKVVGVEINKEAVLCADENKKSNKVNNVEFMCGDANKLVKKLKADVVIVDPARSGLTKEGINNILDINPQRIIYVSCNPISLARDLKEFGRSYDIKDVVLFDMFPWTYHVETVCVLTNKVL